MRAAKKKSFGQSPLNWFMHLLPSLAPVCLGVHRGKKYSAVAHRGFLFKTQLHRITNRSEGN